MQRLDAILIRLIGWQGGGRGGADGRVAVTGTYRRQFFKIFFKKTLSHPDTSNGFTV